MGRWTWPFLVGLVALLIVMAVLQYRWIGEVSRADQARLRSALSSAAQRFAGDFDRQLADLFVAFLPGMAAAGQQPAAWLPQRYLRWKEQAAYPGLVRGVVVVETSVEQVSCLDLSTDRLAPCRPTGDVAVLIESLGHDHRPALTDPNVPALVLPLGRRAPRPGMAMRPPPWPGRLIIELDRGVVTTQVLPDLVEEDFSGLDCTVWVFAGPRADTPVYTNHPAPTDRGSVRGDVEVPFFGLGAAGAALAQHLDEVLPPTAPRRGLGRLWREQLRRAQTDTGAWRLVVAYRAGSVDAAVAALRRRNLAISGAILLLLGASVVMIVLSTRRAQALADRQIQFVAGVSHELKTPLAAIQSAAENLAEGVVADPEQVREYGRLVDREGRRLGRMVGEILELAGLQGRRTRLTRQPVNVELLVAGAVDDCRWTLDAHDMQVELDLPRDLPSVPGDPDALRRAIANLVDNAAKHADSGRLVAIRARADRGTDELLLVVSDRGQGIHRRDLPHIFEPFFRGRGGPARARGSGLGLSLVKQIVEGHGGRVTVETGKGGTAFTVHLPVGSAEDDDGAR